MVHHRGDDFVVEVEDVVNRFVVEDVSRVAVVDDFVVEADVCCGRFVHRQVYDRFVHCGT